MSGERLSAEKGVIYEVLFEHLYPSCAASVLEAAAEAVRARLAEELEPFSSALEQMGRNLRAVTASEKGRETGQCHCRIVGWMRIPGEPHIPAQPEWEQADDCPVHPLRSVTATEWGCTCDGMAACPQCQDRDAALSSRPGPQS